MILGTATPSPPLADLFERFWQYSAAHRRERILSSGTFELVINLREDEIRIYDPLHPDRCVRSSGAVVSRPYGRPFVIDPQQHAAIMGGWIRQCGGRCKRSVDVTVDVTDAREAEGGGA